MHLAVYLFAYLFVYLFMYSDVRLVAFCVTPCTSLCRKHVDLWFQGATCFPVDGDIGTTQGLDPWCDRNLLEVGRVAIKKLTGVCQRDSSP